MADCGCYAIYSAALFPTSNFCAGVKNEYVLRARLALFFNSTSLTFTFASTIAVGGTVSLNGPLGSGRFGFSLKGLKYLKIDTVHSCPVNILVINYPHFLKCKFGWVKLWRIASNSPKFSPAIVLHYTV